MRGLGRGFRDGSCRGILSEKEVLERRGIGLRDGSCRFLNNENIEKRKEFLEKELEEINKILGGKNV